MPRLPNSRPNSHRNRLIWASGHPTLRCYEFLHFNGGSPMKFRSTLLATSLAIAALAVAAPALADCNYQKPPDKIPDGTKASKEEMIAGMKAMRTYNDLVKQYT